MVVATHVVKVRGSFDKNIWDEEKLRKYVRRKIICNIYDVLYPNLILFKVDNDKIEVRVYVHGYSSEVTKDIIKKWIDKNIVEEGLTVEDFEYEMMVDITKYGWKDKPFINIESWPPCDDMDKEERELYIKNIRDEFSKTNDMYLKYNRDKEEKRKEERIRHTYIRN